MSKKMRIGLSSSPFSGALKALTGGAATKESKPAKSAERKDSLKSAPTEKANVAGTKTSGVKKPAVEPKSSYVPAVAPAQSSHRASAEVAGVIRSVYFAADLWGPSHSICGGGKKYPTFNKLVNYALRKLLTEEKVI